MSDANEEMIFIQENVQIISTQEVNKYYDTREKGASVI